jgi:hypothetical protein
VILKNLYHHTIFTEGSGPQNRNVFESIIGPSLKKCAKCHVNHRSAVLRISDTP